MERKLEHIDNLFREGLGGYTETPPPSVWDALEERLDDKDKKRPGFFYRRYWFIILLAFVSVGGSSLLAYRMFGGAPQAALATNAGNDANAPKNEATPNTDRPAGTNNAPKDNGVTEISAVAANNTAKNDKKAVIHKKRGTKNVATNTSINAVDVAVAAQANTVIVNKSNTNIVANKTKTTKPEIDMNQALALNSETTNELPNNPQPSTKTTVIKYIVKNTTHNHIAVAEAEPVIVNIEEGSTDNTISNPLDGQEDDITFGNTETNVKKAHINKYASSKHHTTTPNQIAAVRNCSTRKNALTEVVNQKKARKNYVGIVPVASIGNSGATIQKKGVAQDVHKVALSSGSRSKVPTGTLVSSSIKQLPNQVTNTAKEINEQKDLAINTPQKTINNTQNTFSTKVERKINNKVSNSTIKASVPAPVEPISSKTPVQHLPISGIAEVKAKNEKAEGNKVAAEAATIEPEKVASKIVATSTAKTTTVGEKTIATSGTSKKVAEKVVASTVVKPVSAIAHENVIASSQTIKKSGAKHNINVAGKLENTSATVSDDAVAVVKNKPATHLPAENIKHSIATSGKGVTFKKGSTAKQRAKTKAAAQQTAAQILASASKKHVTKRVAADKTEEIEGLAANIKQPKAKHAKTKGTTTSTVNTIAKDKKPVSSAPIAMNSNKAAKSNTNKQVEPKQAGNTVAVPENAKTTTPEVKPVLQAKADAPKQTPVVAKVDSAAMKPKADSAVAPAVAKDDSPAAEKSKRTFLGFEVGIKAGYEGGMGAGAANKFVATPFLERKISSKFSLLLQPGIKFAGLSSKALSGSQSFYDVDNNSTNVTSQKTLIVTQNGDTIWRIDEHITQSHTNVSKTYSIGGKYLEFELPILLKYNISKKFSVYGGVNLSYSKLIPIHENTSRSAGIVNSWDTFYVTPDPPPALNTVITYSGTPLSGYKAPLYPSPVGGSFRIGYMLGFSYQFNKRWLADILFQQGNAKSNTQGGYNVNTALSAPYFRFTIGYKLFQ